MSRPFLNGADILAWRLHILEEARRAYSYRSSFVKKTHHHPVSSKADLANMRVSKALLNLEDCSTSLNATVLQYSQEMTRY